MIAAKPSGATLPRASRRRGFTMVELLIVVSIIALLAGLLLSGIWVLRQRANSIATEKLVEQVALGLQTVRAEVGGFPDPDPDPAPSTIGSNYAGFIDRTDTADRGVYEQLTDRNLLPGDLVRQVDVGGGRQRLADRWNQPLRYVIAYDSNPNQADDHGHQPRQLRENDPHFADWVHLDSQVYVYSYGPDNPTGADLQAWIFFERGGG